MKYGFDDSDSKRSNVKRRAAKPLWSYDIGDEPPLEEWSPDGEIVRHIEPEYE